MSKGYVHWEEREQGLVEVQYLEVLPKAKAMRVVAFLRHHEGLVTSKEQQTIVQKVSARNTSFGQSLYWGQKNTREVLAFFAWCSLALTLFVVAAWRHP